MASSSVNVPICIWWAVSHQPRLLLVVISIDPQPTAGTYSSMSEGVLDSIEDQQPWSRDAAEYALKIPLTSAAGGTTSLVSCATMSRIRGAIISVSRQSIQQKNSYEMRSHGSSRLR